MYPKYSPYCDYSSSFEWLLNIRWCIWSIHGIRRRPQTTRPSIGMWSDSISHCTAAQMYRNMHKCYGRWPRLLTMEYLADAFVHRVAQVRLTHIRRPHDLSWRFAGMFGALVPHYYWLYMKIIRHKYEYEKKSVLRQLNGKMDNVSAWAHTYQANVEVILVARISKWFR